MRSTWRTIDPGLLRDIALVCLADGVVGLSYGAISVGGGLDLWVPVLLSIVVFAGASQFLFVGIVAAGGSPIAATIAGLLVNSRHVAFGLAVSDVIGNGWRRPLGSHMMTDENVAFALGQDDVRQKRAAYWVCGIGIFVCWNIGVVIGALAGSVITDTDVFGLDAAFPAVLLALVLPSLRDKKTRTAALVGSVAALAATPFLPAGLPILLALVGLVFYRSDKPALKVVPMNTTLLLVGILVLAVGTFSLRLAGPLMRTRFELPERAQQVMAAAAVVLLAALVATAALTDGPGGAGIARPAGVLVGGVLAWRKAPFVLVVIAAAATAAGLRLLGVP